MSAHAPFIVVNGNIAAGKSTLVQRLSVELELPAHPEHVERNPFFGAPSDRSLQSEAWFLADSVASQRAIQRAHRGGVQERSVQDHVAVFAQARFRLGWLGAQELALLQRLAHLLGEDLQPPDLLVYVEADVAVIQQRIAARARPDEQQLDSGYLSLLDQLYDELIDSWALSPVYRLDSARLDVRKPDGLAIACRQIQEALVR